MESDLKRHADGHVIANPITVLGKVAELLEEGRKTIDELREQVIPMRVLILEIATKFWQITDDAYCPYCGNWYGNIPEGNDNIEYDIHESHCVVSAAYHFVKTVPILK